MPRYAAFLRGVSPLNAKMPELKRCFEQAGFGDVKTLLSSGNVVFDARAASEAAIERRAEAAMQAGLGRSFYTIVRRTDALRALLDADPYLAFEVEPQAKRVVSFKRAPIMVGEHTPPIAVDDARVLCVEGREIFSVYVPGDRGPVFMGMIERAFGTDITTRTWDTVRKCAAA